MKSLRAMPRRPKPARPLDSIEPAAPTFFRWERATVHAMTHPSTVAHMTEAEYLAYDREHEGKFEFVNGEVIAMSGVTHAHDVIQVNLIVALSNRLRGH